MLGYDKANCPAHNKLSKAVENGYSNSDLKSSRAYVNIHNLVRRIFVYLKGKVEAHTAIFSFNNDFERRVRRRNDALHGYATALLIEIIVLFRIRYVAPCIAVKLSHRFNIAGVEGFEESGKSFACCRVGQLHFARCRFRVRRGFLPRRYRD